MNNIRRLASSIRDYVNTSNLYDKYYKDNPDKWNMLCVSMDTLGDTCEALLNFESEGVEGNFGGKYLRLYGVLQGVFLQQDAIKYLCKSLGQPLPKLKESSSSWKTIRKLRNLTVGHPVEVKINKTVKRCFITRVSISSQGFWLVVYNASENKNEFEAIDLQKLYSGYKEEASAILNEILGNLENAS
jgi:hypothetical protein